MKKELHHFILYAAIIFLTGGALLNPVVAALQPLDRNGTHSCGVIDCPRNMQYLGQLPNRHYAQSFPANFSSGKPHIVRLIYFVPNDRTPQRDIDAKIDRLIKDAQQSFAEVMENHGFGRKTFQFEMDTSGKAIVHHMTGQFQDAHYGAQPYEEVWDMVWQEISDTFKQFDPTTNVYFAVMDIGGESFNINGGPPDFILCGLGAFYGSFAGRALMPASGDCFSTDIATHELGHAFGLLHDRFKNANRRPSSYHADLMTSSFCAAEWLDVHRYFNIGKIYPRRDSLTTIQMSPPVASSANAIRLRFEITDTDGLQQAQLFWIEDVIACQGLNGQSDVYEFELIPASHGTSDFIVLRVIDVHGNFIEEFYSIDITSLLPAPTEVSIPDTNLATAIRQELNLAIGDTLTQSNLSQLVSLDASSRGITNLSGLEHATQLQTLILSNNRITDIGGLAGLTNLTELYLGPELVGGQWINSNSISDISALTGLTGLRELDLAYNSISDISSLAGLTDMDVLYLGGNSISDISPLAGLTNMTWLDLGENSISDISVLTGFTYLTRVWLWDNSISDISPLVANTGLGNGDAVYLQHNPLSYLSLDTHIRTLQSRRVTVEFDNRAYPALLKFSGDNQIGVAGAALSDPFIVEVQDGNGAALAGTPVVFTVTAGSGTLSTTHITTNANGRARSTLTLGPNLGTNTVEVSASGIDVPVTFTAVARATEGISIPDSNLRARIGAALGVAASAEITPSMMATLTNLDAHNAGISDLTGLELAANLTSLDLRDNSVSDISLIAKLTKLTWLNLKGNSISNIVWVSRLTNLTWLNLRGNSVSDISSIRKLTKLTWLDLRENDISDISPLILNTGLGSGDTVNVKGNSLSDQSFNTHISTLQSRGVTVEFDSQLEMDPDKITGPWLWIIAPTTPGQGGANSNNVDSLAAASNGTVTEAGIAADGAKEGDAVGNHVWTLGRISEIGGNNINDLINAIGLAQGDVNHHSAYALITLESVTTQSNVTMHVGSDDSIKVWLNGEVVHSNPMNRGSTDFQDRFTVNLKQGDNLLLVKVSERTGGWSMFVGIEADVNAVYKRPSDPVVSADVNRDGVVNILDLVVIASQFGRAGQNLAVDVNEDGSINILDLILVAGMFDGAAAAPAVQPPASEVLTAIEVQGWLTDARALEVRDPIMKRGIMVLEQFLISLTPTETKLLPNYPNPFNPETWIPYRLAEDAFVRLTIYDQTGQVVRTIDVGHRIASAYEDRSKAIYWDGRNDVGEQLASGVYFYHLSAGDYSATRKMVILK